MKIRKVIIGLISRILQIKNHSSVLLCTFGFRKDGGAILTLLINDTDYKTVELDPRDIKSMYSKVQMAERGLFDKMK